jgi:hypothetical protein
VSTGVYTGTDLANKTFYGFRPTQKTGNLDIEIINDGTTTVSLPEPGYIIGPNEYAAWIWSTGTYQFRWGSKGHLEMVFI